MKLTYLRTRSSHRKVLKLPPPEPAAPQAETIPLRILYEDADLIVIDKPAGLVVHPGAGNNDGTLVNGTLDFTFTMADGMRISMSATFADDKLTGTMKIGDQTYTVTEAAASCSFRLSASGAVFGKAGGSGSVSITASGAGCTPGLPSSTGFVTL